MHTFEWEDEWPKEGRDIYAPDDDQTVVTVTYHGDYSGDALINVPEAMWHQILQTQSRTGFEQRVEFKLPADLLAKFSRAATLSEVTEMLEQMQ